MNNDIITVTSPLLPDLAEFNAMLQDIWPRKWITNMGYYRGKLENALAGYQLQPQNADSLRDMDVFIYRCFMHRLTIWDKMRLHIADGLLIFFHRFLYCKELDMLCYRLLILGRIC